MKHKLSQFTVKEPPVSYSGKQEKGLVTVPIHQAKSNLSKLVKRAAAGETIYIGAYGKPEVALTVVNHRKYRAELRKKAFGGMKGKMVLHEGWEAPLSDDIIDSFYSMEGFEEFEKK